MFGRTTTARLFSIALCWLAACATSSKAEEPLSGPIDVRGSAIQLPSATAAASSEAALRDAMLTACEGPCDRAFLVLTAETSSETVAKVIAAARGLSTPPVVALLPPSDKPIAVSLVRSSPAQCPTTVSIEPDGISVAFAGEPAKPDRTCDDWTSIVCRTDEGYDWPRLRTVVGDVDGVCVHLGIDAVGDELDALNDALLRPTVQFVGPIELRGTLPDGAAADQIAAAQRDFDWCFRQVLDDTPPSDVRVRLLVDEGGEVARAEVVKSVRGTPQFEECVEDAATKLRFSEPGGLVVLEADVPTPD